LCQCLLSAQAPASYSAPAASYAAPAASAGAGAGAGLEGLAAWIATNYMGAGKSAADVLPELRRKGITASGNSYYMNGQLMDAPAIAQAMRLQVRACACVWVRAYTCVGVRGHASVSCCILHATAE